LTPRRAGSLRLSLLLCFALAVAMFALLPLRKAEAHPLGNFTINHYSRIEFSDEAARVTYILDLAEIPTLQQKKHLDTDGDGTLSDTEAAAYLDDELPSLLKGLRLEVGNEVLPLRVLDRSAKFVAGQGRLPTLRIEARLLADLPNDWEEHDAGYYTDRNYDDRIGWREIVVRGGPGVAIENSTAPSADASNELRSYPQDSLSSPLDVREARFTLAPGNGIGAVRATEGSRMDNSAGVPGRVASLISAGRLSASIIMISMLIAFFWGAAHALTPGHGKTVVAAYLVGTRGTARHAGLLGLTVTLTHTVGVFALGAVTLYLSRYVVPEALYPWLSIVSGLLVVAIGLSLLYRRLRGVFWVSSGKVEHTRAEPPLAESTHTYHHSSREQRHTHAHPARAHSHKDHHHPHTGHEHAHSHGDHSHSHLPPGADGSKVTWRSLLILGVSGGLVPCPAALVLLLSAISLHRLGFGIVLVVAFSAGLAIVLTGIGLLMIHSKRLFERFSFEARVPRFLPVASAMAVSLAGLAIMLGALKQAGIV
jgi:nickel/cobalt transporter (NicO) family protein